MVNIDKIKTLASDNGIKLSFITQKLGIQHTYFADIKRHNRDIPDDRLQTIADILNTTPEYLRDQTDDPTPSSTEMTEEEKNILGLLHKMSEDELKTVYKIISAMAGEE